MGSEPMLAGFRVSSLPSALRSRLCCGDREGFALHRSPSHLWVEHEALLSQSSTLASSLFLIPLRYHRERNTVQRAASRSRESCLEIRDLQARAAPCNTRTITRGSGVYR